MGLIARFFIFRSMTGLPMGGIASGRGVAIRGRDGLPASARGTHELPKPKRSGGQARAEDM
jgi:hypothetical protein